MWLETRPSRSANLEFSVKAFKNGAMNSIGFTALDTLHGTNLQTSAGRLLLKPFQFLPTTASSKFRNTSSTCNCTCSVLSQIILFSLAKIANGRVQCLPVVSCIRWSEQWRSMKLHATSRHLLVSGRALKCCLPPGRSACFFHCYLVDEHWRCFGSLTSVIVAAQLLENK